MRKAGLFCYGLSSFVSTGFIRLFGLVKRPNSEWKLSNQWYFKNIVCMDNSLNSIEYGK